MVKFVLVLATLVGAIFATVVNQCENIELPLSVDISGCDKGPCKVVRGKNVVGNMTFKAPNDITKLIPNAYAEVFGFGVNYPLEKTGCESLLSGNCPLARGDQAIYQLELPILKSYPLVTVQLTFTMKDQNSKDVFCFKVDLKVVKR